MKPFKKIFRHNITNPGTSVERFPGTDEINNNGGNE